MAKPLLSKRVLNKINRTLYASAQVTFYSITPSAGEVEIGAVTQGFTVFREQPGPGRDGSAVKMLLAEDAGISRETLNNAAVATITIDGRTVRYAIDQFLPMQQLGAGYVLRLLAQKGATA